MSSTDELSPSIPTLVENESTKINIDDGSLPVKNGVLHENLETDENVNHDEGMNNEPQLDDDEYEKIPVTSISNNTQMEISTVTDVISKNDSNLHPLLEADIKDVFSKVSTKFLAGIFYELDPNDSSNTIINFHFYTDHIETETACQWQICNKKPLTCQIMVHNEFYIDRKVTVVRVYQLCECHPINAIKVPFIERIVRDYFEKVHFTMETLKLSRAASNPDLRLKYFLEIISDKARRTQVQEMLTETNDESLFYELLDYEILESNKKTAQKLQYLRLRRDNSSNNNIHYDYRDVKNLPKLDNGYLVQFCTYFEYRMKNLNSLCVMCGNHTISSTDKRALKPTICDDYKCFSNAMDSKFRSDPLPPSIFSIEIADFLLLLVHAAIHSNRHTLILDPYPKLINPYNTSTTLIDQYGDKNQNIVELREIIDKIMTMGSITQYEAAKISLRSMIELKHPWGFSFFHWLMGTNRYHFSLIPEQHQIKDVATIYQYFIKHEDIDKHVNFKNLRAQKGSIFAFHGSPQENWHSILRSGLQIGKGGYLINGAAYGAGIYVSPSFEFSSSYTRSHHYYGNRDQNTSIDFNGEEAPLQKRNWSCMALCEIINSPDVYKKHTGDIWTIQDQNLICTRFIFFFRGSPHASLRVDNEQKSSQIRELIHTLNNIAL